MVYIIMHNHLCYLACACYRDSNSRYYRARTGRIRSQKTVLFCAL